MIVSSYHLAPAWSMVVEETRPHEDFIRPKDEQQNAVERGDEQRQQQPAAAATDNEDEEYLVAVEAGTEDEAYIGAVEAEDEEGAEQLWDETMVKDEMDEEHEGTQCGGLATTKQEELSAAEEDYCVEEDSCGLEVKDESGSGAALWDGKGEMDKGVSPDDVPAVGQDALWKAIQEGIDEGLADLHHQRVGEGRDWDHHPEAPESKSFNAQASPPAVSNADDDVDTGIVETVGINLPRVKNRTREGWATHASTAHRPCTRRRCSACLSSRACTRRVRRT